MLIANTGVVRVSKAMMEVAAWLDDREDFAAFQSATSRNELKK